MKLRPLLAPALAGLALVVWSQSTVDPVLSADLLSVSLSRGGEQQFVIDAGSGFGGRRYLIAGSASGAFPGTLLGSVRVPINFDGYTELLLQSMHSPAYSGFDGHLDSKGRATARLHLPSTPSNGLVGTVYHHAAVILDPKTKDVVAATNAVEVLLLP